MAKAKTEKTREASANTRPGTSELVVTLDVPAGQITKVEILESGGTRHVLTGAEFAHLIGGDELEEFAAALDEAYEAGIADGIEDALFVKSGERKPGVKKSRAERVIGAEARRVLFRRAVLRSRAGKRARRGGNGAHGTR